MCDDTFRLLSGENERGASLFMPAASFSPSGLPLMNDLRTRLYWIMGLRMALVTLMLGLSLAFQVAKGGWVETFYALIIVTYILTIPSVVLLRVCYLTGGAHDIFLDPGGDRLPS